MGVEHLNIQHRDFIQAYFPCGKRCRFSFERNLVLSDKVISGQREIFKADPEMPVSAGV
jgi:hypothetical protein